MALTDNLKAYYKLDGNSNDSGSGGYNGTDSNMSYTTGKISQCGSFNGSNSFIDISADVFQSMTSRTLSAWVKPGSVEFRNIIRFENKFMFLTTQDPCFYFLMKDSGGTLRPIYFEIYNYNTSSRYLLTMTNSGTTTNCYINGAYVGGSSSYSTYTGPKGVQYIGREAPGIYRDGLIDEIGIWSRALSSTEITELYNSGAGLTYPFTTTPVFIPPVTMF